MATTAPHEVLSSDHLIMVRGEAANRVFMHTLLTFVHRTERERRGFYGGDLVTAAVAETVGVAAIEPVMRDPGFRKRFADYGAVMGTELQRPVNALSVAAAIGIPRETVRRKLKALVEKGILVEKDGGYVYKPGVLQRPEITGAVDRVMQHTVLFINDCLTLGLFKLAPRTARKSQVAKDRQ